MAARKRTSRTTTPPTEPDLGAAAEVHAGAQIASLTQALRVAEEAQQQAAAELRATVERVEHLTAELAATQESLVEAERELADLRKVANRATGQTAVRVLLCRQDGRDELHTLRRRTSIGRTPDNDIQVDTSSASRRHAVVMANADHVIVKDLNSTNGVLVNGRRIDQQILNDGDTLTIGGVEFKYQQRS